ncbi:MAG TPA: hypothetical protein VD928_01970 [Candidatus Paceibacterota bacterium]|nr:hypothetical protein [Candidatus Paceibacterota bacterium]
MNRDFHEIALQSILFKGRGDVYFCYLKSEKIAHVLFVLAQHSGVKDSDDFENLLTLSAQLPQTIVHFVAGEVDAASVLADIFSLLSSVRLSATAGYISSENVALIAAEYENLAKRIAGENHPSPFVSSKDFSVHEVKLISEPKSLFTSAASALESREMSHTGIKDKNKRHDEGQNNRTSQILDFVRSHKGVSIKDIAAVVRGCSEKTIQRELGNLIERGLVERKGERRWSLYFGVGSPA